MHLDLTDRAGLWIATGPADLTAEVTVGARPVRVPLGRIACGFLPAVDAGSAAPGLRLTARLTQQGTARAVAWDSREAADAVTPEAADAWIEGFGRMLAALVAAGPRIDAAIAPGEFRRIAAPQALASRRGIAWLLTDGRGLAGFGIATATGPLAVTQDAWAQATANGTVRAAASRFLWAGGGLPEALRATQEAWIAAIPALAALGEVDRHQGERSRQVRALALLSAAERQATGNGGSQSGIPVEEPALAVAAELAHRMGLPLRVPPKRLRRTADQPYSLPDIALASGFRLRRVTVAEAVAGSVPLPLALERAGTVELVRSPVAELPTEGAVLWGPVRPVKPSRLSARAILPLLRHGREAVRAALLDRLLRLPAARLREVEAGRWASWLDRLENAATGLSSDLLRIGAAGPMAVAAIAILAGLAGWPAALAAAGGAALVAAGGIGEADSRDDGLDGGGPAALAALDLAALDRLPKIRSMAAQRWILLGWYQARSTGSRISAVLRPGLRAAALGSAPLLGSACAPAMPWVAAAMTTLGVLAGGAALAAASRFARTLRSESFPGVPAGSFDLDPSDAVQRSDPGDLIGQIAAVGLSVRRTDEERWLFADLDLAVAPGEFVALVGPSGCGKTTLLSILLGQRQPTAGAVFYDGYDLRSLEPAVLARAVASVGQRDQLRPGTIRDMLDEGRGLPDDRLWAGLATVGLDRKIAGLPGGLDTRLALGQASMSRGQAQRLLLTRALLAPASILILDEPTAALDAAAETLAVQAIARSPATRIVATHREAVVRAADRVIDLRAVGHPRFG